MSVTSPSQVGPTCIVMHLEHKSIKEYKSSYLGELNQLRQEKKASDLTVVHSSIPSQSRAFRI